MEFTDLQRTHLSIDPSILEEECFIQADLRGQYAEKEAEAAEKESNCKLAVEKAKEDLSRKEGELRLFISKKKNWEDEFDKAPTEKLAEGWVKNHKEYVAIYEDYIVQRERLNKATSKVNKYHAMVSSMDTKKKMLELSVSLHNGSYWAAPNTDGGIEPGKRFEDIGNEYEEEEIKEARDEYKEKRKRKRKQA